MSQFMTNKFRSEQKTPVTGAIKASHNPDMNYGQPSANCPDVPIEEAIK